MSNFELTLVSVLSMLLAIALARIIHGIRYGRRYPESQRLAVNYVRSSHTDPTACEGESMGSHGVNHFSHFLLMAEDSVVVLVKTIYFRGGYNNGTAVHFVTVDPKRNRVVSCATPFENLKNAGDQ